MKLLLIRHGLSVGNREGIIQGHADYPLSDEGRAQARALGQRLQNDAWSLTALYASDLSRATETAQILGQALSLPVHSDKRLREYNFGILNGLVWQDVESLHPEIWRHLHETHEWPPIPGEEGEAAFLARVAGAVAEITARHQEDAAVAVVAHGGSLGILLAHLLGAPTRRPTPFRLENCSLSIVDLRYRQPVLTMVNDTRHLSPRIRNATQPRCAGAS
jgi:broad specificity phosphatase PhoE